jgi:hypothetical protein
MHRAPEQRTPKGPGQDRRIFSDNWRSNSSDGSEQSPTKPKVIPAEGNYGDAQRKLSFHVQEHVSESSDPASDRLNAYSVVKAEDAQAVYPPSCCVFVAKYVLHHHLLDIITMLTTSSLLQSENEDSLQMAVTQIFREYGPVFVKIRRDGKHMPFAFCQYTVGNSVYKTAVLPLSRNRNRSMPSEPSEKVEGVSSKVDHVAVRKPRPIVRQTPSCIYHRLMYVQASFSLNVNMGRWSLLRKSESFLNVSARSNFAIQLHMLNVLHSISMKVSSSSSRCTMKVKMLNL